MNREDLNLRYSQSVILYNGEPFYVAEFLDTTRISGRILSTGRNTEINFSDIDTTPIRLGYVNGYTTPRYVTRKPARYYKQGLTSRSLEVVDHVQGAVGLRLNDDFLFASNLIDTIKNNYPSFNEALANVNSEQHFPCQAFSRDFCLFKQRYIDLLWRKRTIGRIENGEAVVLQKYSYLQDSLQEKVNEG